MSQSLVRKAMKHSSKGHEVFQSQVELSMVSACSMSSTGSIVQLAVAVNVP